MLQEFNYWRRGGRQRQRGAMYAALSFFEHWISSNLLENGQLRWVESVTHVCTALCFPKEPGTSEEDHYSIEKHFKFQAGIKEKSLGRNLKEIKWKETKIEFQITQVWSSGSFNGKRKIVTCKKRSPLLKISSFMVTWKCCHGQRKRELSTMLRQVCIPLCHLVPDKNGKYLCKRKHLQNASVGGVDIRRKLQVKPFQYVHFYVVRIWSGESVCNSWNIVDYSIMLLE